MTPEEGREPDELEVVVRESLAFAREMPAPDREPAVM